ncbi:MAG: globin [Pseudomonadota bacterium]
MTDRSPNPDKLLEMTAAFYERAVEDEVIGEMFSKAATDHAAHLASWLSVVFGGSRDYLRERGDLGFVMYKHMGLGISEAQRARWANLMMDAAAEQFGDDEAFLRRIARFVHSITHSVREVSNLESDEVRRMIGLAPGEEMLPISDEAN